MKYEVINKHHSEYPVKKMCKILKVSKSGFHKWLKRSKTESSSELTLKVRINEVYQKGRNAYGYIRVTDKLKEQGVNVNKKKVARLMKELGLYGLTEKRFRPKTTLSDHNNPISPNLVKRNFQVKEKNRIWVSDITYIRVGNKWCYLCVIIDLANREVVGWSFEKHMRTEMVIKAMEKAVQRRGAEHLKGLIFHSDRGSQYASHEFKNYLESLDIRSSMSAKGNCYDNAVAESFFSVLKREEVKRKKYKDIQEAKLNLFDYIETFYNRERAHSALNNKAPMKVAA